MFGLDSFPSSKSERKSGMKKDIAVGIGGKRRTSEIEEEKTERGFSGFDGFEEDRKNEHFGANGGESGKEKGGGLGEEIEREEGHKGEHKERRTDDLKTCILEQTEETNQISNETQEKLEKGSIINLKSSENDKYSPEMNIL